MEQVIDERKSGAKYRGLFTAECYRKGKLIWTEKFSNLFVDEGLTHMLAVTVTGKTLIEPFYCVLFETNTTILVSHDYAVPGYTEVNAAVDEGTRPIYVDVISNKSVTNAASKAVFTFNTGKTIYGAALVGGSNVKGNVTDAATHVELCAAKFGASRAVVDDDVINLTYVVTSADDGV